MKMYIFTLIVLITSLTSISATIINIPDDYNTIQEGIDASSDGDTVLVQPGTYVENINFNGHNIVLGSLFFITDDTSYISNTIIDGDSTGSVVTIGNISGTPIVTGFTIQNGYNWSGGGIFCTNGSSPNITYNIIIGNIASSNGGGIFCRYSSSPTIHDNIIRENEASGGNGWGGGILSFLGGSPLIFNNIIVDNNATMSGGGICCGSESQNTQIYNNVIEGNTAGGKGGGIMCWESLNSTISNNIISDNSASAYGGGIACYDCNPIIDNNDIIENSVELYNGGGIYCDRADPLIANNEIIGNLTFGRYGNGGGISCFIADPIILNNIIFENEVFGFNGYGSGIYCYGSYSQINNNTIYGNKATNDGFGAGIFCGNHSYPVIINAILYSDTAQHGSEIYIDETSSISITYSNIEGGWEGEGNIDVDPLFRDPENGDFHLMAIECDDPYDSPCIDMGHPDILDSLIDCSWGLGELRSDMGAYGGGDSAGVRVDDLIKQLPKRFTLSQNYPNPFNAATVIEYALPEATHVTLDIYDILGRKVETLYNGNQPAAYHQVIWKADDKSTGIYFYKITTGQFTNTKKMLLLK